MYWVEVSVVVASILDNVAVMGVMIVVWWRWWSWW